MNLRAPIPGPIHAPLLALALCAGCHLPEATVYNLREVREPDGSPRRVGAPLSSLEFAFRFSVMPFLPQNDGVVDPEDEVIDDPDGLALEHLLDLYAFDRDDAWVLGLQVEIATWLAIDDSYRLARERSVLALGPIGRALGLPEPIQLPAGYDAATADDLVGPLGDLIRDVRELIQQGRDPGESLVATCEGIAEMPLDRDGARRVASVANSLLKQAGHDAPELEPLRVLFRTTASRAVAIALASALEDPDPIVRAAAFEATFRACGDRLVGLRRQGLDDASPEVLIAVMHGLSRRGLFVPPDVPPADAEQLRLIFLGRLVELTRDLRGSVSSAACDALARLTRDEAGPDGAAPEPTLRWEEWNRWWEGRLAARTGTGAADRSGS